MSAVAPRTFQGEVVEWDEAKRHGFILPRGRRPGEEVVFLSRRELTNRRREPKVGDIVIYCVAMVDGEPGRRLRTRQRATRVAYLGEEAIREVARGRSEAFAVLGGFHLLALLVIATDHQMAVWIGLASLALSLVATAFYAWDKAVAGRGGSRVPESTLQTLALLGGWPGAALAQSRLRHKTRKASFQTTFAVVVALNTVVVYATLLLIARRD